MDRYTQPLPDTITALAHHANSLCGAAEPHKTVEAAAAYQLPGAAVHMARAAALQSTVECIQPLAVQGQHPAQRKAGTLI